MSRMADESRHWQLKVYMKLCADVLELQEQELALSLGVEELRLLKERTADDPLLKRRVDIKRREMQELEIEHARLQEENERLEKKAARVRDRNVEKRAKGPLTEEDAGPPPKPFAQLSDDDESEDEDAAAAAEAAQKKAKAKRKRMTAAQLRIEKQLRESFDIIDVDRSGEVDTDEFRSLCKRLDPSMSAAAIKNAITAIDENGDGVITYDEFRNWWYHGDRKVMGGNFFLERVGVREAMTNGRWLQNLQKTAKDEDEAAEELAREDQQVEQHLREKKASAAALGVAMGDISDGSDETA
eukprot:SAG22_NODE_5666_length_975_cov_1.004566_1_plen_299_part_00